MLMPKRVKWRKQMRGRMRGKSLRGSDVVFGDFGLKALEPGWVTARQIEAARRAIVRELCAVVENSGFAYSLISHILTNQQKPAWVKGRVMLSIG